MEPLTGGCLCGGVRYEITEPLVAASYCHCTRCQRRTGTAAGCSATPVPGSFTILQGEELLKAWTPGDDGWAKVFCSNCGGAMYSQDPADPDRIGVRMGTFDSDPGIRPRYRHHTATAAVWEPIPDDGLRRYPDAPES
jgi:hypothetical protein